MRGEHDEHAELLVADEAVLGLGRHEDRLPLRELHALALELEGAGSLEDDVDLVVFVRLLAIGFGSDEDVDAELEVRRGVDDLVAALAGARAASNQIEVASTGGRSRRTRRLPRPSRVVPAA